MHAAAVLHIPGHHPFTLPSRQQSMPLSLYVTWMDNSTAGRGLRTGCELFLTANYDSCATWLFTGIMELSLLRTFAPGSESTMVWNFRSLELSFPGTFALERKFLELSLPGTFAPWNFRSRERKFQELSLPRQVTFGHRRRLNGGDRPHGQKVVGTMTSSSPHRNFGAIFETVKCSVKL